MRVIATIYSTVRTAEQLRQHYEIEKELAGRLRHSQPDQRAAMYSEVYDELFRRVPEHPQWTDQNTAARERKIQGQLRLLRPYLTPETVFLELGAGELDVDQRPLAGADNGSSVYLAGCDPLGDAPRADAAHLGEFRFADQRQGAFHF